jgi:hypothetical protein
MMISPPQKKTAVAMRNDFIQRYTLPIKDQVKPMLRSEILNRGEFLDSFCFRISQELWSPKKVSELLSENIQHVLPLPVY